MLFYLFVIFLGYLMGILGFYFILKSPWPIVSLLAGAMTLLGSLLVTLGTVLTIFHKII